MLREGVVWAYVGEGHLGGGGGPSKPHLGPDPHLGGTRFYYLGINFPIAQGICYTGLCVRNSLCSIRRLHDVLFCAIRANLHTLIVWELIFQLHTHNVKHERIVS